jgi:glycosyltransferase involved in cell wall biosynthesis
MEILFYDVATPLAYDAATPKTQALGGTEATLIRIAQGLKNYHTIYVAQHCRASMANLNCDGVNYISLETAQQLRPQVVILLRHYRLAEEVANYFPKARRYLWLHNMPSRELYSARKALSRHQYQIIAVSHFHRRAIEKRLNGKWYQRVFTLPYSESRASIPIQVLYNPIDETLQPDATPIQSNQLLFMSSPQKGLPETLRLFEGVQKTFPEYQLLIANPGYNQMDLKLPAQARFLGALPHHEVIQKLRESFCVFYPQYVRVETFGLVYAEANAVGTPVLAHDSGAAAEVLSDPKQLVNGHELSSVLNKLKEWREKRPTLCGRNEFRLNNVIKAWLNLLG